MRIGRLEINQSPTDQPGRHIPRARAERFIARRIAKWIVAGKILQMIVDDAVIRGDAQYLRTRIEIIPAKRKHWRQGLLLTYPHKSQESKKFALKAHPFSEL